MPPKKGGSGTKKSPAAKRKSSLSSPQGNSPGSSKTQVGDGKESDDSGSAFRIILRRTKSPVRTCDGPKSPCCPSACSSSSENCCKSALKCTQCFDPCTGCPYLQCTRTCDPPRPKKPKCPSPKPCCSCPRCSPCSPCSPCPPCPPPQVKCCVPCCEPCCEPCCDPCCDPCCVPCMAKPCPGLCYRVPCATYKDMPCDPKPAPLINVKYDGCSSEDISLKIKSSHRKPEFDTSKYDVWIIQCPKEFDINNALNRMTTAEGKSMLGDNVEPVIEPYNQMKMFTMFCKVEATPDNLSFIPAGKIIFKPREDDDDDGKKKGGKRGGAASKGKGKRPAKKK